MEESGPRTVVEFPFCEFTEKRVSTFRKKLNCFTNDSYDLIVWLTKKVRLFFPLKDKNLCPSCKIYYGLCSCGEDQKKCFVYVMMNIASLLKSQNQLHTLKRTLTINSLGRYYVMHQKTKKKLKKNFMAPFYWWGSTFLRPQSHFEEAVYFLPQEHVRILRHFLYQTWDLV